MIPHCTTDDIAGRGTLEVARAYVAAGLSLVPIRRDGSKAPAVAWACLQDRLPTDDELVRWLDRPDPWGIATIGGAISGGLEIIDFDRDAVALLESWRDLVEVDAPGLVDRLCIVQTPREPAGYHVRYRVRGMAVPGNARLAVDPGGQALIETRGEGGYALAPGSPPECHETGRPYVHIAGPPLTDLPVLTPEERAILIRCAASLSRVAEEPAGPRPPGDPGTGLRPGDDYCARGPDWAQLLEPAGWTCARTLGAVRYWRRPDKEQGWSATTGACTSRAGHDLLCVFSSNADPFPGPSAGRLCSTHSRFAAYALLEHQGNFKAAARELSRQGYGARAHESNGHTNGQGRGEACGLPRNGYQIILDYFRQTYEPTFRRGKVLYSAALARTIDHGEACLAPGIELVDLLTRASDCPRKVVQKDKDSEPVWVPNRQAIPKFFKTWAPVAWQDLVASLAEEESAAEIAEGAAGEFRRRVAACLFSHATFGEVREDDTTQTQRRSLIGWCRLWAKPGGWRQIRDLLLWTRRDQDGKLELALRVGLFSQQGPRELAEMGQYRFAQLCERYDVGTSDKACGQRVVILAAAFLAELLVSPATDGSQAGNGRSDDESFAHAHAREESAQSSTEEPAP